MPLAFGESPEKKELVPAGMSTFALAKYFGDKLRAACFHSQIVNRPALAKNFSGMREQGVEAKLIKEAIDIFAAQVRRDPSMVRGKPVWKVFLARRSALIEQARASANTQTYASKEDQEFITMGDLEL